MTLRLYFQDDELNVPVQVLGCTRVDDSFIAILDATPFHPQGGGQPSDTGWIGEARVLRVLQEGEQILHQLSQPLEPGSFTARVDPDPRLFNSRMHSAGHLIGHFGQSQGWIPVKAHHWPGEGRVSFKPGPVAQAIDADLVHSAIEQWISADLQRRIELQDGMRQLGFGPLPAFGCGGTHVQRLRELGQVRIESVTEKKGVLSVSYDLA